jgi:RNA polymerase sigma factor (sigma-70 family)
MEKSYTTTLSTTSTNSFNRAFPAEAVHKIAVKFVEIYSRTRGKGMCKEVLEDLRQDIELKAFLAWDRYDPSRSKLETWVSRIATNAATDAFRSDERRAERFVSYQSHNRNGDEYIDLAIKSDRLNGRPIYTSPVSGYETDRDIESLEAVDRIQDVLGSLSENQGYILSLYLDEGLTPKQIATVIGCTPQAVSSHLFRARKTVAKKLGKEFLSDNGYVS